MKFIICLYSTFGIALPFIIQLMPINSVKILKIDPRDRPSAAELRQDKWFDLRGDVIALTTKLICCPTYRNNAMVLVSDPLLDVPGISL
jgi:hypothetical protein